MSMLKKGVGLDVNTSDLVKQGKGTVQNTANQCVQEGQKIAQEGQRIAEEAIDKGCNAAKDAGHKAVDHVKGGCKHK